MSLVFTVYIYSGESLRQQVGEMADSYTEARWMDNTNHAMTKKGLSGKEEQYRAV